LTTVFWTNGRYYRYSRIEPEFGQIHHVKNARFWNQLIGPWFLLVFYTDFQKILGQHFWISQKIRKNPLKNPKNLLLFLLLCSRGSAPLWLCPSSSFCSSSSKVLPIPSIHKQSRPTPPPIPVFLFKTTPPKKQNKDASTINHQPKQRHRCTVV